MPSTAATDRRPWVSPVLRERIRFISGFSGACWSLIALCAAFAAALAAFALDAISFFVFSNLAETACLAAAPFLPAAKLRVRSPSK